MPGPVVPVLLCGGQGTRLWPLSRAARPKPLLPLGPGDTTLLAATLARVATLVTRPPLAIAAPGAHEAIVAQLPPAARVLVEPVGRGTAAPIAAAALLAYPDDVLLVLPTDHAVADDEAWRGALAQAVAQAEAHDALVILGIAAQHPETGFGWIRTSADGSGRVDRFVEKPVAALAERLLVEGGWSWNAGVFVARAGTLRALFARYAPDLIDAVAAALPATADAPGVTHLGPAWASVRAAAFDRAIVEVATDVRCVSVDAGWSDLGTFASLWAAGAADSAGNVVSGDTTLLDVSGSLVHATSRTVVVVGVQDLVVVETADAVLVVPRDRTQDVRDAVESLGVHPCR